MISRDRAYDEIAAILLEWFPDVEWTRDLVDETAELAAQGHHEGFFDPSMAYAEFGVKLLRRLDLLEDA